MRSEGTQGSQQQEFSPFEPEYALAALRARLEDAIKFADLCGRLAPEIAKATHDLILHERELFRLTSRHVLRRSV